MTRTYFKAKTIPNLYKYNDGLEDYYLQLGENEFAIMQKDDIDSSIKFKQITNDEFKTEISNTDIVDTIKSLLE